MNTALEIIPKAAGLGIKPKPSKREIVEALAKLKEEEVAAERKAASDQIAKLKAEINPELLEIAADNLANGRHSIAYGFKSSDKVVQVSVETMIGDEKLSKGLRAKLLTLHALQEIASRHLDAGVLRRQIAENIAGDNTLERRVESLLAVPEIRQQLTAALKEL